LRLSGFVSWDPPIRLRLTKFFGMTVGKSAAEVNKGRDATAAKEIDALWREIKAAATKAARAKRRGGGQ
jgi:hypothetical protein